MKYIKPSEAPEGIFYHSRTKKEYFKLPDGQVLLLTIAPDGERLAKKVDLPDVREYTKEYPAQTFGA